MLSYHNYQASLIIPTYNRAELLEYTLQTLRNQTSIHSFEVIVVDDGSTDHTMQVVQSFQRELQIKYVYQPDEGFRVARARNLGISLAEASICIFIDAGVLVSNDFIHQHVKVHEHNHSPCAVIGYAAGLSHDNYGAEALIKAIQANRFDQDVGELLEQAAFKDIREVCYRKYQDNITTLPAPWVLFWTCNVSAPTHLLLQINGFDENYTSWGVEDVDVGYSLFLSGAEFHLCRKAIAIHYPHERDENNRKNAFLNRQYFSEKFKTKEARMLAEQRALDINDILLDPSLNIMK